MHFLFPSLAFGFVLVAAPLLVHLINLLRHRRQEWAAMEFLVAAYRKQRKWVVLRQLLLLALRTLGIALLVAMLAGWVSGSRLLDALGGTTQHHLVVLDDSYSMEDRSAGNSAYQRALLTLDGFVKRIVEDAGEHQLTVLRTSRAALATRTGISAGDAATDISGETIVAGDRTLARVTSTAPVAMGMGLEPALQLAADLSEHSTADQTHLYLMTDLRSAQWQAPRRMAELLGAVSRNGVDLKLIDCGVAPQTNLGITELIPQGDVWAAGVPARVQLRVQNFGDQAVTDVSVAVSVIRFSTDAVALTDQSTSGIVEPLPNLVIERIEPRNEAIKVFQVFIPEAGIHAISAKLPDDVVTTDNQRVCTLPLVESRKLLLVEGDPNARLSYFLRSAIDPGGAVRTGWSVDVRGSTFLSTASVQDLSAYSVVWLLDLPQVDGPMAQSLQAYVQAGGGLGIWCGAQSRVDSYNDFLFGPGRLMAGHLLPASDLKPSNGSDGSDITLDQPHPITASIAAVGQAMLGGVRVQRTFGWEANGDPAAITTLLRTRDDRPLAMVNRLGEGRALAMLTALDPSWTNWPADPTFVVFVLRAAAELSLGNQPPTSYRIGDAAQVAIPDGIVSRSAELLAFGTPPRAMTDINISVATDGSRSTIKLDPASALVERRAELTGILSPGVCELWMTTADGRPTVVPIALVPDSKEGDLRRIDRSALIQSLRPLSLEILGPEALSERADSAGSSARTLLLLALLALVVAAEQWVAYWASYHQRPATVGGRR